MMTVADLNLPESVWGFLQPLKKTVHSPLEQLALQGLPELQDTHRRAAYLSVALQPKARRNLEELQVELQKMTWVDPVEPRTRLMKAACNSMVVLEAPPHTIGNPLVHLEHHIVKGVGWMRVVLELPVVLHTSGWKVVRVAHLDTHRILHSAEDYLEDSMTC